MAFESSANQECIRADSIGWHIHVHRGRSAHVRIPLCVLDTTLDESIPKESRTEGIEESGMSITTPISG